MACSLYKPSAVDSLGLSSTEATVLQCNGMATAYARKAFF